MSNAKPSDHVIERAQLWVCANCSEPEIENTLLEALEALAILQQNSDEPTAEHWRAAIKEWYTDHSVEPMWAASLRAIERRARELSKEGK